MNLGQMLRGSAERFPDKPALVGSATGETRTYSDLDKRVDAVAHALQRLGVGHGDRVALGMHNVPSFPETYLAAVRIGAIAVLLNPSLTQPETKRILEDSGARLAVCTGGYADIVEAAAADLDAVERVLSAGSWEVGEGFPDEVEVAEDDIAVLAYTSGTTGEPKGAMLSHGNLIANLRQQIEVPGATVTDEDVLLLSLPLFHIFGLNVTLGLGLMTGATSVLVDRFEPIAMLKAIQDHAITIMFGAPTMYAALLDTPGADQYDVSSVRFAISGAAPLTDATLKRFKQVFGITIYEGYGLTETAPTLWSNRVADEPKPGSVGKPLPDVEFRLIDDRGRDVEVGDPGEIIVRGPNVFKGYWNRPEETKQAFFHGWFRTGDIGVLDEDGYLYLVDRKRDLILVSGFNVFPSEVENALLQDPAVAEAAVIGVPHPYTGEAVQAFVVLEAGADAAPEELLERVRSRLARFKCPQAIQIVDELPHLLTGKVLRRALRT